MWTENKLYFKKLRQVLLCCEGPKNIVWETFFLNSNSKAVICHFSVYPSPVWWSQSLSNVWLSGWHRDRINPFPMGKSNKMWYFGPLLACYPFKTIREYLIFPRSVCTTVFYMSLSKFLWDLLKLSKKIFFFYFNLDVFMYTI